MYLSRNLGATWTNISAGIGEQPVYRLARDGKTLYALTYVQSVWKTTDDGQTWNTANTGLPTFQNQAIAVCGNYVYVSTLQGDVFRSSDSGGHWSTFNTGLPAETVVSLVVWGKTLIAGTRNAVYYLPENETAWINTGLSPTYINALAVSGTDLYAGTEYEGVWSRPLKELSTGVESRVLIVPKRFSLDQNFPNPFNPSTTISFKIPSRQFVTLKIFNVLGKEVATLTNEELPAGTYSRQWNASGYPSGVYFYRLQAGAYAETKRLIILR